MLDLSPDLKREFDAIAEQHETAYKLKEFDEYDIGVNWAAATVQRLKMLYADSPVVYDAFVASCQNVRYPPQDERIGELDEERMRGDHACDLSVVYTKRARGIVMSIVGLFCPSFYDGQNNPTILMSIIPGPFSVC